SYEPKVYASSSNTIAQSAVFPNAAATDELELNEVLCFAENSFSEKSTTFNDSASTGNCYYNSRLMSTMNDFYNNNLTDLPIVEKTLKTVWSGASDKTNGSNLTGTYKIFPLAGANANESFYIFNYLTSGSDAMKQSNGWWLRSGAASVADDAYYVSENGGIISSYYGSTVTYSTVGVRPAFVLNLFG
ncbi:MAG: DUF6273 domain-containing protein, partial [Clostridia bacterium]